MAEDRLNGKIGNLFRREQWEEARRILERQREKDPHNHWVLTQLGVTFYEERRYEEALQLFLASQKIVPECPLTLWNLAGSLDSLGKHASAIQIYTWLLLSKRSPDDDPCWESKEWADSLKADCVYRVGVCFQRLRKKRKAEDCYHQYLDLLSIGIEGSYSIDDVKRQMRQLHGEGRTSAIESEFRKAANATLEASGIGLRKGRRNRLPKLNVRELFSGHLAASK
ncbi:MAG: tetratricopeptide repeat protein [Thermoguttaceae bacterium]|jgi:tetratricopeptide (TPR) repeat protein